MDKKGWGLIWGNIAQFSVNLMVKILFSPLLPELVMNSLKYKDSMLHEDTNWLLQWTGK